MTQLRPVAQNAPWKPESDQWNELIARASRNELAGGGYFDSLGNVMRRLFKGPPVVPFSPDATVPAYGVFIARAANNKNDYWVYEGNQATVHGGGSIVLVNGGDDAASGTIGWAGEARDVPVWALYDASDGAPQTGESWGPKADLWSLGRGLPGFVVLSVDSDNGRVLVLRTPGDNARTAELTSSGASSGTATLWYGGAPTGLSVQVSDDMLDSSDAIPADTMITVQFWPHASAWKILNAACPAGS